MSQNMIVAVRYDSSKSQITQVKCYFNGMEIIKTKQDIVADIDIMGYLYITAYRANGKWWKGADVHVVSVDGIKYIRTDRNTKKEDNLGNLQEF